MIDWVINFASSNVTSLMGILLYWLPLVMCAVGYVIRTGRNFHKDRIAREARRVARLERSALPENEQVRVSVPYYTPSDTIGTLIGRAIVTILPIGNLLAAVFDIFPNFFGRFMEWVSEVFNQPLVPEDRN